MNTPSHAVLNLALLGRRNRPEANAAVAAGAVLPDLPILVFYLLATLVGGQSWQQIWSESYFQTPWQAAFAIPHSFPLIALGWGVARAARRDAVQLFFASLFLHSLLDFPLHHDDAHRHFFPLSDWRFASPVSYWDPNRYGSIVAPLEMLLVLALSVRVFWLLRARWSRGLLLTIDGVYLLGLLFSLARFAGA